MTHSLRVALLQLGATRSKEESLKRIKQLLSRVAKEEPDLVALPEYSMMDPTGLGPDEVLRVAEPLDGPWARFFENAASEHGFHIVFTMFEKREGFSKAFNTAVLVGPRGPGIVYRKTHLFDAMGYRESDLFEKGDELSSVAEVNGFRVGLAICFEIRYPEIFRSLALRGADVVVVPAGWYRGPVKEEQIAFLARTRSHENTMYTVVPVLYGDNFTGRSLVTDPYGVVLVDAGIGERITVAELSRDVLEEARRTFPLLRLRRPELYRL